MNGLHIYKASAGSGKTTTLAAEYIKLLFREERGWRAALAVTFTNKAAAEIKGRILEYLHELGHTPYEQLGGALPHVLDELCGELNPENPVAARPKVRELARRNLTGLLHDYGAFGVSTIDSFFQRMLRAFTRELDITFDFEVEMDAETMLDAALRRFFGQIGNSRRLTEWLLAFLQEKMGDGARPGWRIQGDFRDLGRELFSDRFMSLPREAVGPETQFARMDAYRARLLELKSGAEARMREVAEEGLALMAAHDLEVEDFNRGKNGFMLVYRKIMGDNFAPPTKTLARAYEDALEDRNIKWVANDSDKKAAAARCLAAGLEDNFRELARLETEGGRWLRTLALLRETLYTQGMMADLRNELNACLAERDLFMISDTNYRLLEISGAGDAPFIFEKLGTRYRRYLIDEFQDTSRAQWANLLPLVEDALAEGERALIVGDVKQAIYRWRGGDFKLLLEGVEQDLHPFREQIRTRSLNVNYRSLPGVVRFNNSVFLALRELTKELDPAPGVAEMVGQMYRTEDLVQKPGKQEPEGFASVEFFEGTKEETLERQLDRAREIIEEKTAGGYRLSDIVVLTRTKDQAAKIAARLYAADVRPVISETSLKLKYSPAAQVLVSAMRLLHAPEDKLAAARLLHFRAICAGGPPFDWRAWTRRQQEGGDLLPKWTPPAFHERAAFLHKLSLPEMTEELIRCFGLEQTSDAYLARFLDLTLEFTARQGASLEGFLRWFDEKGGEQSVVVSPEADGVRIMTIHKSKGLEFPVVILPFADWRLKPGGKSWLWAPLNENVRARLDLEAPPAFAPVKDKQDLTETYFDDDYYAEWRDTYADGLNLLYVALTRAAREVRVLARQPSKSKTASPADGVNGLLKAALARGYDFASGAPGLEALTLPLSLHFSGVDFEYGAPPTPVASGPDAGAPAPLHLEEFVSLSWRERIVMQKETELAQLLKPGPRKENAGAAVARDWGALVHEVMAELPLSDNLPAELAFLLKRRSLRGRISADDALRLQAEAGALLARPEAAEWFAPKAGKILKQEASVLVREGRTYRPDLVVLEDGGAVVIDWKTGRPRPEHAEQLREYGKSMRNMGYAPVKLRLAYLSETAEIVGVD